MILTVYLYLLPQVEAGVARKVPTVARTVVDIDVRLFVTYLHCNYSFKLAQLTVYIAGNFRGVKNR